jgi:hypothetical protein
MITKVAHDLVNDVAIIKTQFCYNVRYGLEVTPCNSLNEAWVKFHDAQGHAMTCQGLAVYKS